MQRAGCNALAYLAEDSPACGAAIAATGGVDRVTAAMVRFPDVSWVQFSCQAAVDALPAAETSCTCRTWASDDCHGCSTAQVIGAMGAAPDDHFVQSYGCYALTNRAYGSPANRAAIAAAGGVERVTAAMVRFPDVSWVHFSCQAAVDALPAAEARCTCHAWTSDDCISCSPAQVVVALDAAPDDRTCSTSAATRWC